MFRNRNRLIRFQAMRTRVNFFSSPKNSPSLACDLNVLNSKTSGFLFLVVVFLLATTCYYYYLFTYHGDLLRTTQTFAKRDESKYTINTSTCHIPEMYLKGPQIDKYTKPHGALNCEWTNYTLPLISSNLTGLTLNSSALAALNVAEDDPMFECYHTSLLRDDDRHTNVKFGEKIYFKTSTIVSDEMVEVVCTLNGTTIYWDYHIFVRPTPSAMDFKDGNLSVLILGLDAVSRVNFHRQMPETSALLSRIGNVEMLGYNKVEDNTFPNLVPVLSGLSVDELKARCWPSERDTFDKCHFVWSDFKSNNFDTFYIEDCPHIGVFHYVKYGFRRRPTDHDLRPLMLQAERTSGNKHCGNTKCCTGPKLTLDSLLDYTLKVAVSMAPNLYWNFVWSSSLTHDFVEYAAYGDRVLRDFFARFNETGEMNKTVVILMSDHGIRWGGFRKTYQGSLEDRLPLLKFIVPEWFRNQHPAAWENLKMNARRLTTPYDLHETLLEFVDPSGWSRLDDDSVARRSRDMLRDDAEQGRRRGVSLFLKVPEDRTCTNAGIPIHYCTCHGVTQPVSVNNAQVIAAAVYFVEHVNDELSEYPQCANLTLSSVVKATVEGRRDGEKLVKDYQIQVTTVPGHGHFEATVRHDTDNKQFRLMGSVSRLNLYGNQSACVTDAKTKLLCYCK